MLPDSRPVPTVVELWHNRSGLRIDLMALLALQQNGILESVLGAVVLLDRMGEEGYGPEVVEAGEDGEEEEGDTEGTGQEASGPPSSGSPFQTPPPFPLSPPVRPPTFQELWQRFLESRGQMPPGGIGKKPPEEPPGATVGGG